MTREEAAERLKAILEEATEDENAVCYVTSYDADTLEMAIKALEQTEPERKPGECNQCHAEYTDMPTCMGKVIYEYCPMCGSKMEVEA